MLWNCENGYYDILLQQYQWFFKLWHSLYRKQLEGRSVHYRGKLAVTEDGVACQRWDAQTPYAHGYTNPIYFPDATVEEAGNYCRRLDERWPWCCTNSSWDWCGKLELICSACKYAFESKCFKLYFRTSASTEVLQITHTYCCISLYYCCMILIKYANFYHVYCALSSLL